MIQYGKYDFLKNAFKNRVFLQMFLKISGYCFGVILKNATAPGAQYEVPVSFYERHR